VLRGNHLDTLVTDEATGARILDIASQEGFSA
jgi:DNA-binding transcriptional regulator LsrR (DeoR family)